MSRLTQDDYRYRALDGLLSIGNAEHEGVAERIMAYATILNAPPFDMGTPVLTEDGTIDFAQGFDVGTADEPAEEPAVAEEMPEKPKRTRRTKAEMEAARATATDAQPVEPEPSIRANPEAREEPAAEPEPEVSSWDDEPADEPSPEPAPQVPPPATKDEVVALLNRYAAKHPGKAAGAQAVIEGYSTTGLKDVSPGDYAALAAELRAYVEG